MQDGKDWLQEDVSSHGDDVVDVATLRPTRRFDSNPVRVNTTTKHTNDDHWCHYRELRTSMWQYQHRGANETFGDRSAAMAATGSGGATFHSNSGTK